MDESKQCCYGAAKPVEGLPDEPGLAESPERSTALPAWVEELSGQNGNRRKPPFSEKWANKLQGLSINGEEFLTADSFGLQRSATADLIADAREFNFSFTVYPHPSDREQVQVLCWRETLEG